jgi:uncharacterized YigZ family protein
VETEKSTYRTIASISEGVYKEKGSKFIAYAVACYTEEEAKKQLDSWRKMHYQSRHVCYAYRFGLDQKVFRANDDGEPMNSAGAPILGQIQSNDLSNVLIGVVRYFGGTKLGVGGLVQAYKSAAKDAIYNGEIIELEVFEWVQITFEYAAIPAVMKILKKYELAMKEQLFELECSLICNFTLQKKESIKQEILGIASVKLTSLGVY